MPANLIHLKKNPAKSEIDLIKMLKLGNEKAFTFLYVEYSDVILARIKKTVGCKLTAEDILQNVFLKIWLNIDNYNREKGSLFTWMISIARNEATDYLRSSQSKKISSTDTLTINEKEIQVEANVEQGLNHIDILKSLTFLQCQDKAILQLFSFGYTCKEVSNLLSLPVGTVKSKMRRSYKKLRVILA